MKHIKQLALLLACSVSFTSCVVSYGAYGATVDPVGYVVAATSVPQYYTYCYRPSVYSHYDYAVARDHGRQNLYGRYCHY
jgi:hypothetical protein